MNRKSYKKKKKKNKNINKNSYMSNIFAGATNSRIAAFDEEVGSESLSQVCLQILRRLGFERSHSWATRHVAL